MSNGSSWWLTPPYLLIYFVFFKSQLLRELAQKNQKQRVVGPSSFLYPPPPHLLLWTRSQFLLMSGASPRKQISRWSHPQKETDGCAYLKKEARKLIPWMTQQTVSFFSPFSIACVYCQTPKDTKSNCTQDRRHDLNCFYICRASEIYFIFVISLSKRKEKLHQGLSLFPPYSA